MADREKVIQEWESVLSRDPLDAPWDLIDDTLELLKEQEAVEPTVGGITEHDGHGSWWYQCGKCKMPIDYGDKFCKRCGQEVKWDAAD